MFPELVLDFSALDRLPTDQDLPCSDGEPMDTPWHRATIALLIETLEYHRRGRKDFYCGGDMFLYFSPQHVFNKDFRGPDFFVVNGVDHDRPRLSWVVWQEGRFPNVIVELASPSTIDTDRGPKRALYRDTFLTPEYYIYDPETDTFDGYQKRNGSEPMDIEPGNRVWSRALELYIGTWDGEYVGHTARWVRFFDVHGRLIPTGAERAAAEAARRRDAELSTTAAQEQAARNADRASQEKERADRETLRANAESARAEAETARARAIAAKAEAEAARASAETARAEAEVATRVAAEAELARLRAELAALKFPPPPTP